MIAKELAAQLAALAAKNDQKALVDFTKSKITAGELTIADLFAYARDAQSPQKHSRTHLVTPEMLNYLGVMITGLENPEQKKQAWQFFKLSAERNNALGCRNYASGLLRGDYGCEKSAEQALVWIKKSDRVGRSC